MDLYIFLKLCVYLSLSPIVYRVIIKIDFSRIFKKNSTTEIKIFYFMIIVIITKIIGDVITMFMDYIRLMLSMPI